MADNDDDYVKVPKEEEASSSLSPMSPPKQRLAIRIMSKRRTWVFLFISVYTILLFSSWNIIKSLLYWYHQSNSSAWPAIYVSLLLGLMFGLLSMAAALAVAVPATLVTWITVLVLLTFFGKPRKDVVVEGKKLTAEISGFVVRVLIKEGNLVAALCALLGYFALVRKTHHEEG